MSANVAVNVRPDYDKVIQDIADYVIHCEFDSSEAMDTAGYCLMDTLDCGLLALRFPECTKHLGPVVRGTSAEFYSQTACEAAIKLHATAKERLDEIHRIVITTHESAIRIISKVGPLANPADRDHCLQYMTAVSLVFGALVSEHYEDEFHSAHPIIDELREKMEVVEDERYSR